MVCIVVGIRTAALHSKELSLLRLGWETSLSLLAFVPKLSTCSVELNGGLVLLPLYYWGENVFFFSGVLICYVKEVLFKHHHTVGW